MIFLFQKWVWRRRLALATWESCHVLVEWAASVMADSIKNLNLKSATATASKPAFPGRLVERNVLAQVSVVITFFLLHKSKEEQGSLHLKMWQDSGHVARKNHNIGCFAFTLSTFFYKDYVLWFLTLPGHPQLSPQLSGCASRRKYILLSYGRRWV